MDRHNEPSHCHKAARVFSKDKYNEYDSGRWMCADCGGDPRSPEQVKRDNDNYERQARNQTQAGWIVGTIILAILAVMALTHYHDPQPDAAPSLCEQAQTC